MPRLASLALLCAVSVVAQSTDHFDVSSVRISPRSAPSTWSEPGDSTFTASNITLRTLIQMAYEVTESQLAGDQLCGEERYDISAQPASGALTPERLKTMIENLLSDRFSLRTHREVRTTSGYTLVVTKQGPKFKRSDLLTSSQSAILRGRLIARGADLSGFAAMLARPIGAPVVDGTNLSGLYDLELRFAPEDNPDSGQPSIFTAVQEQLGLKLEPQRVPLNMLVVDRCPNPASMAGSGASEQTPPPATPRAPEADCRRCAPGSPRPPAQPSPDSTTP